MNGAKTLPPTPQELFALVDDLLNPKAPWIGTTYPIDSARKLAISVRRLAKEVYATRNPIAHLGVIGEISDERTRQIDVEGYDQAHDDAHDAGELAAAGASYALNAACVLHPLNGTPLDEPPVFWMRSREWWKPKDARRDLIRATALIVAEIERIDRSTQSQHPPEKQP